MIEIEVSGLKFQEKNTWIQKDRITLFLKAKKSILIIKGLSEKSLILQERQQKRTEVSH